MPPTRKKAPKQNAPQTIEEATAMIGEYMGLQHQITLLDEHHAADIQKIKDRRDNDIAPLDAKAKELFKQLRVWWSVEKDQMTDGKRKSIEIAGAIIGERTATPSFRLPRGIQMPEFIGSLIEALPIGVAQLFVRTKHSLDKQALIKSLRADDDNARFIRKVGGTIVQPDQFFIDHAGANVPDPETVDVEEAAL